MKRAADLNPRDLVDLVAYIQQMLYLDQIGDLQWWNANATWQVGHLDQIGEKLRQYGLAPEAAFECQDCAAQFVRAEDLDEVQDLAERVDPGEPLPYGQCPICAALVHKIDSSQ